MLNKTSYYRYECAAVLKKKVGAALRGRLQRQLAVRRQAAPAGAIRRLLTVCTRYNYIINDPSMMDGPP